MSVWSDLFGKKPELPAMQKLSLGDEQAKAVAANRSVLPAAQKLVADANAFSIDQVSKMLENVIPNYKGITNSVSKNIGSLVKGEIPSDVSDLVQNSAAARSLGGGTAGSGMSRNLVARDLGLTSLNLMNEGLSSAESWMRTTASLYEPSMMSVLSMFVSPAEMASFDVNERNAQFSHDWLASQIAAMPDPSSAGEATFFLNLGTGGLAAYESGGKSLSQAGGASEHPSSGSGGGWNWGGGGGGGSGDGSNDFTPYSDYSGTYQPEPEATSTNISTGTADSGGGGSSASVSSAASIAAMFA